MSEPTRSTSVASSLIAELIALGVRDIVVSPGSRSQALALAAAEAERLGFIRLHVRIDERSAAFLALGIARETGTAAPVIVTSGTAVANLLPAVLEAGHARVPMLVLSADRPAELRHRRTAQTISDLSFMSNHVRFSHTIAVTATQVHEVTRQAWQATATGAAHLNVEFSEPLSGGDTNLAQLITTRLHEPPRRTETDATETEATEPEAIEPEAIEHVYTHGPYAPNTVVIAGADAGAAAETFAHAARLPLLAEPTSGARYGPQAVQHWATLLETFADEIERVVVFGHPTLTRVVPRIIERVPTVLIDEVAHDIERYNPGGVIRHIAQAAEVSHDYDATKAVAWLRGWITADRTLQAQHTTVHEPDLEAARATGYRERSEYARAEVARLRAPVTREHLTETVWRATWPHDRLVVASSRLIRVLNRMAAPRNIRAIANRGLAGIDGTIATALGVAIASQSHEDPRQAAGTTRVLIGDLAFFHDVGSLALTETRPRIQIIIGHDGGGTIFDELEVAASANPEDFDRVMLTAQQIEVEALAEAYGWCYTRADNQGELERLLIAQVTGPEIIEVPLARAAMGSNL